MSKAKKVTLVKIFLPSGGDIEVPLEDVKDEKALRNGLKEMDPAVVDAELVKNEDGSIQFVRTAGTKQRLVDGDLLEFLQLIANLKKLAIVKAHLSKTARKQKVGKLFKGLHRLLSKV